MTYATKNCPPIEVCATNLCGSSLCAFVRSHLGTLALKPEDFSKQKSVVLEKRQKVDLLKPSLGQKTLEEQGEERFSKSIFAVY